MSLEFIDGFDHWSNQTNGARKWDTTAWGSYGLATGRFGGAAANTSGANGLTQGQLAAVATRTIGFAFYCTAVVNNSPNILIQFLDGATEQVSVRWGSTAGTLVVSRAGTTLGTSTATPIVPNTWYYLEFQATINSTTGSYTLKIVSGGVETTWLTASGVNTQNTANATTNGLTVGSTSGVGMLFDDLYILNSSGSVNNTFLGECRILTSMPSADSATNAAWTPNSGTAHFSRVNETYPDDDTSYVSSATAGQLDTYSFATVSPTGAVACVQTVLCARKDDAGGRTIASEYRGGGTNYTGSNSFSPGSGYLMFRQIYETDPATGLAWTGSGINAGEFGVNCVA